MLGDEKLNFKSISKELIKMALGTGLAAAFIFFSNPSAPQEYNCARTLIMMQKLSDKFFAYTAIFEDNNHKTFALYTKIKTREWIVVGVDNNINSCIIAKGTNWYWGIE